MLFAYPGAINDNHPVCGTQPEFLAPPPQLHITAVAIGRQVAPAVSMFELGLELEDQTPQIKTGPHNKGNMFVSRKKPGHLDFFRHVFPSFSSHPNFLTPQALRPYMSRHFCLWLIGFQWPPSALRLRPPASPALSGIIPPIATNQ
eukprot:s1050_g4.t1